MLLILYDYIELKVYVLYVRMGCGSKYIIWSFKCLTMFNLIWYEFFYFECFEHLREEIVNIFEIAGVKYSWQTRKHDLVCLCRLIFVKVWSSKSLVLNVNV
jgi:hypothetical protein